MAPQKQHAVFVTTFDNEKPEDNLQYLETDTPKPKDGEVLVRITLRVINPTDSYHSRGDYGGEAPFVTGSEGVGIVEELGAGTSGRLSKGQRVVAGDWGLTSWQEYAAIEEKFLVAVPDDISDEIAAQVFITTLTVIGLVETAAVPKLIQYAKSQGIKTINVVRRSSQFDELKALGADELIDSSKEDVVARVKEITGGKGAYSGLDAVAGDSTTQVMASLRAGGTAVWYGWVSDPVMRVRVQDAFAKTLTNFIIYSWLPSHGPEKARALFDDGFKLFRDGVLSANPGRRYPLAEFRKAMEESKQPGRSATSPKVFLES